MTFNNTVFDRDSGKPIVIQYPVFDLMMSDGSLSFRTSSHLLPIDKLTLLIKCFLALQTLPEVALQEAYEELEGISSFYRGRSPRSALPTISESSIKGKLRVPQVRPTIVLES